MFHWLNVLLASTNGTASELSFRTPLLSHVQWPRPQYYDRHRAEASQQHQ